MPRKEAKGFQWGTSGVFAMMCFEVNHSPVEGDLDQTSAHHTEEPHSEKENLEVHLEEKSGEQHVLEKQLKQSLSQVHHQTLQD